MLPVLIRVVIISVLLSTAATPTASSAAHPPEKQVGCHCKRVKLHNGWCQQCNIGYVAGLTVRSYQLVEAIDTHGHDIDPQTLSCAQCREAAKVNGLCKRCGWGIVGDKIFASKLTYALAMAKPQDMNTLECDACTKAIGTVQWLDPCQTGWVGHFAFERRDHWELAARQYRLLVKAVQSIERCEDCAVARYYGSYCTKCDKRYKNGEVVPRTKPMPNPTTKPETSGDS